MGPRRYYLPFGIRYDCCILPDILDSTSGLLDDLLGILHCVKNCSGFDTRPLSTNRLIEAMAGIPSDLAIRYRLWGRRTASGCPHASADDRISRSHPGVRNG